MVPEMREPRWGQADGGMLMGIEALRAALQRMVYETTHLSPMEDDGSHWCKISAEALAQARAALLPPAPTTGDDT